MIEELGYHRQRESLMGLAIQFGPTEPKGILLDMAQAPRPIENCWWANPVKIDFDLEYGDVPPSDPHHQRFMTGLVESLGRQVIKGEHHKLPYMPQSKFNHIFPLPHSPGPDSDMIIGFYDIPKVAGSLMDKVPEIEPMALIANKKYFKEEDNTNALKKNYTVVVTIDEDIAKMPKRKAEEITRMLMIRLGAMKVVMIHPNKENSREVDYYALGTMEGGLAVEYADRPGAIDRLRDRLVTHACAKDSGSFEEQLDVISEKDWRKAKVPEFIGQVSRQLAEWGYIDKPFDITTVASEERAKLIEYIMRWSGSRQNESAVAAFEPMINVPEKFRMGEATGVIVSSLSGRFGADKRLLTKSDTVPVAIVRRKDYEPNPKDPLALEGFDRYSLGVVGQKKGEVGGPSIEFDEMSAAMMYSGFVRVSLHESGMGYKLDPNGTIVIPRVRGFVHMHQGIDEISSKIIPDLGRSARELTEYVRANFIDFPYPVGCGKDIMFACSTDAARRSQVVHYREEDPNYQLPPGAQVVFFDALDHGTNALVVTEPLPGTDLIRLDPFYAFRQIVDKYSGGIVFSDELAMV